MKKNDILTGYCDSIGYNGEGIIHLDGTTFFVPYCLCGEKIRFKVLKVKGNIGYGKVEEVLQPSTTRVKPVCSVFFKCGGCQLQHTSIEEQLNIKKQTVITAFKKIAFIDVNIDEAVSGENSYAYRNKLQLPVRNENGKVKVGFFREGSHDIVETDCCPIHPDWAKDVIKIIKEFVDGEAITAYNEATKKGLVRHVVVREINNEFIFTVVINADGFNGVNRLIALLSDKFEKFSVYLNVNKSDSNVILSDKFIKVYGSGKIRLNEFGIDYEIGPESFMQVNSEVKKLLYEEVVSAATSEKDCVIIDGYSGAGVLTAMMASSANKAYGVEIIKEASDAAEKLAKDNGLSDKMESICAPCENVLPSIIEKEYNRGNKTVLILDPPRKGVELNVLVSAINNRPDKIIYVACSPQSLARDVGVLTGNLKVEGDKIVGKNENFTPFYTIKQLKLFDLFPQTKHIETVAVLEKA